MKIRDIRKNEYQALGELLVNVYSKRDGFPTPRDQPAYFDMLANIGQLSEQKHTQVLVAIDADESLLGGIVYFSDMAVYGSGGIATQQKNASGIRLLGVSEKARGKGVGKALALQCLQLAKEIGNEQVILHTTDAMQIAWRMYQKLGFERAEALDFSQQGLAVYGFRLKL
jgi:ribosomal protein S18 acetylase RimI-like enzyme